MVDDDVRDDAGRELVVAAARLRVYQGEVAVALEAEVADVAEGQAQALHHLLIFGPADEAAVRHGDLLAAGLAQHPGQDLCGGESVGIGVVVRQHEPAPGLLLALDERLQGGKAVPGGLGDQPRHSAKRSRASCSTAVSSPAAA